MKDTRTKILHAAARLFAQKGFSGTSVRQIVAAAGENVAAVNYHFGDKQTLYRATLAYLLDSFRARLWGKKGVPLSLRDIENLSRAQALALLHQLLDGLVEQSLRREHLPLERIFTQVELESASMRKMLLSYMLPFQERPLKLMQKLTGLPGKSPELVFVTHAVFSQVALNECHRLAMGSILGSRGNLSPAVRKRIKQTIWQNTVAILNSYQKGIKQK